MCLILVFATESLADKSKLSLLHKNILHPRNKYRFCFVMQHGKAAPPPLESGDKGPSAELVLDKDHSFPTPALKRHGGRKIPTTGKEAVKTAVPRLSIVMLVCGTRGDVQPFIALGLKMKVSSYMPYGLPLPFTGLRGCSC